MMNFWEQLQHNKRKYKTWIIFSLFSVFVCATKVYIEYLNNERQCEKEEIDRINNYFQGTLEVYKIPSWIERSHMPTEVSELRYYFYVLQTESDKQMNIPAGAPYWPFSSAKKALKVYNKLSEKEKKDYMVVSQSIVYIAYADEERKTILKKASEYFNEQ